MDAFFWCGWAGRITTCFSVEIVTVTEVCICKRLTVVAWLVTEPSIFPPPVYRAELLSALVGSRPLYRGHGLAGIGVRPWARE